MKKTLIALAVATSAAVSGSAMAWTANGNGGSVDFGGTITPEAQDAVWEVKVGAGKQDLNAELASGQSNVDINLTDDLLVLGVRSVQGGFNGQAGISPQLDYDGKLDTTSFSNGLADLVLDVTDTSGAVIGSLSTKLAASGSWSIKTQSGGTAKSTIIAQNSGHAFWGGLPSNGTLVRDPFVLADRVDSTVAEQFIGKDYKQGQAYTTVFTEPTDVYSAFYLSALLTDNPVKISLNTVPTSDVTWQANLPITVSYQ